VLTLCILLLFLAYSTEQIVRIWPSTGLLSLRRSAPATATVPVATAAGTAGAASGAGVLYPHAPIRLPGGVSPNLSYLPKGHTFVYEDTQHIYTLAAGASDGKPVQLITPGFTYNRAVPPLVTANKQLIYGGDTGIWLIDLQAPVGQPQQLASWPAGQVLTSLKVSSDGSTIAYSRAPANGSGQLEIYAGPLHSSQLIYRATAGRLPSFRVFDFLHGSNTTLLLSDDRGDHRSAWYGLWSLTFSGKTAQPPRALLLDQPQQGPLTLTNQGNTLLYSSALLYAPTPYFNVPADIHSLNYANSLTIATIDPTSQRLVATKELIPPQGDLANTSLYRWIDQPRFSPNDQTLAYVEFSSMQGSTSPRFSALYTMSSTGQGGTTLAATAPVNYIEMDGWLDNHTLLFYADNALYAFNMQQHSLALLTATTGYAHILATLS
jgi:hypothetical protein